MAKKLLKKFLVPRRVVKRGAPPIIKPRRPFAKQATGRTLALRAEPARAPAELAPEPGAEPELDTAALAEAGELGEAAPEEVAELEAVVEPETPAIVAAGEEEPAPAPKRHAD